MKNHYLQPLILLLTFSLSFIFSCKEPDVDPDTAPDQTSNPTVQLGANHKLTVYENQTNDVNADALQAQIINTKEKSILNIYGKFGADKSPLFNKMSTITHHKEGNDTTVFLLLNPSSGQLQTAFIEVKGVKQPFVIKHSYIDGNDKAMNLSFYEYDWSTQKGKLLYEAFYDNSNGTIQETPRFKLRTMKGSGFGTDLALGLTVGVGVAHVVYGAAASAAVLAQAVAVIGAAGPIVAIVGTAIAVEFIIGKIANADEIIPSKNPPKNTPINDPATGNNNPTPNLPPSGCGQITFNVMMGADGHIIVSNINGGTGPYTYRVGISSSFDGSPITSNKYEDGTYIINVKDAKGCIGAMGVSLKREQDPPKGIVGRWNIFRWYYEDKNTAGQWYNVPPGDHLTLDSNGNFTMRYDGGGENGTGSYVFDKDKMQLILTFGPSGKVVANVTKFTATELFIESKIGDEYDIFEMKR